MTTLIEVVDLTKVYPTGLKANDALTLKVCEGEIVGVIGPNGAGKTTLIRQLLGILRPTKGQIKVLGRDVVKHPHAIKGLVGYVPQDPLCYPSLTVEEVVGFVLKFKGYRGAALREKVRQALELVGLEQAATLAGYQLSRGMMKLVLLAMALCQETPLLILDEPTAMVDVERKSRVWEAIHAPASRGVLLASHDLKEVQDCCSRIYFMVGHKFIAEGPPHEVAALARLPVAVTLVPQDRESANNLLASAGATFDVVGDAIEIVCDNLSQGLKYIEDIESSSGLRYLHVEAPSLERAVKKLLIKENSP
ncbi:ABC transporter ATP-binding protein [Dehalococcoidia bacterium]|nr:ABC transporter ATP-binding protein [Dehalococcoidia bacterium]MCL0098108.1 ABC transporter ATP-binding protein [Dehalococcoidia bacterium]